MDEPAHLVVPDREGADGKKQEWAVEGRPPGILGRAGWSSTILKPGETVTVHASPAKNGDPEGIIARVTKADGTVLGNAPNYNREAPAAARPATPAPAAAGARPSFAGVYYPAQQGGGAPPPARRPGEPLPPPTRSSPTSDGSQGRGADAPKLTPEYLAKWNMLAASRISGSYEYDNIHNCLPPGMPAMMSMGYGMEIMQDEQKITFFSEHQDALRRVYLDGRKPSAEVLADPTYAGYSTGRWEGDTLVVDTVALSDEVVHRRLIAAQRQDDRPRADALRRARRARESDHRERSRGADGAVARRAPLSQGNVSERRAARVRVR